MHKPFAIFDMDGTLVDSMLYWQQLGRDYLAGKGITENVLPVLQQLKSLTMSESAALFKDTFHLPGTPEEIMDEMNAVMDNHYRNDIPLKTGAADYLARLKEQGVTLCVASATAQPLMEACLTRLGVIDDFAFLLSCEEVGSGKSRPDIFLEAARRLGAAPADIAVYEDAYFALKTAKNAGFYTVGVYDGSQAFQWAEIQRLADETIADWGISAQAFN